MASFEISADLPFQRSIVWQALTDARALSKWFMETDFAAVAGHRCRFWGKPRRGWRGWADSEVANVVSGERVCFSWQGMPAHDLTWVTVEFEDLQSGGTRLVARHEGFNGSHGFFGGFFLRSRIQSEWKAKLGRQLEPVLRALKAGDLEQALKTTDDAGWFRKRS